MTQNKVIPHIILCHWYQSNYWERLRKERSYDVWWSQAEKNWEMETCSYLLASMRIEYRWVKRSKSTNLLWHSVFWGWWSESFAYVSAPSRVTFHEYRVPDKVDSESARIGCKHYHLSPYCDLFFRSAHSDLWPLSFTQRLSNCNYSQEDVFATWDKPVLQANVSWTQVVSWHQEYLKYSLSPFWCCLLTSRFKTRLQAWIKCTSRDWLISHLSSCAIKKIATLRWLVGG